MTSSQLPVPPASPAAIDIGACIATGIDAVKKNLVFHVVAALVVGLVTSVGFGILTGPMLVGYYRTLQKEAAGQKVDIGDVFRGFDDFVPALVGWLIGYLAMVVGFLLLVVPGLLLMPLPVLACYFVAVGEKDGVMAARRGFEVVKANLLMGMIAMVVLSLLGSLGAIACFVGLLVTMPVAMVATHSLARQMTGVQA